MMNRIVLSGLFAAVSVLPVFSQEQPPVLDPQFGVNSFDLDDYPIGFEQGPDCGFYLSGYYTLTKLGDDGGRLWSVPYNSDPNKFVMSQGGLFVDDENNAYVAVTDFDEYLVSILKYNSAGTQVKKLELPIAPDSYPAALSLTGSRTDGRIYALAEYFDNNILQSMVFIGCFDKNLVLVSSSVFAGPNWGIGGISADGAGYVYYSGINQEYRWLVKKYAAGLSAVEWEFASQDEYNGEHLTIAASTAGVSAGNESYIMYVSSNGAANWRVPMPCEYFSDGLGIDSSGNVYASGTSPEDNVAQVTKFASGNGTAVWTLLEENKEYIYKVLVDSWNRIYTIGEVSGYFYIVRYVYGSGDTTPPAAVTDFAVTDVSSNTITLAWTAPGDDGIIGTASSYDLRYATTGVIASDTDFINAAQVSGVPAPQEAGSAETFTVTGLVPGTTYFFGIRTADEKGNVSGLSNSPTAMTLSAEKYSITKSTGDWQIVTVSSYTAPLVSIVNIFGTTTPASGIGINFTISTFPAGATGFSLSKSSEATNPQGLADVILKLGNIPAEYGVTAICPDCVPEYSSVTFTCCGKLKTDEFRQHDERWANQQLGTNPPHYLIRQTGCALTSVANLINFYANVSTSIVRTDPGTLNQEMIKRGGYNDNDDILWEDISLFSNNRLRYVFDSPDVDYGDLVEDMLPLIDKDILNGLPVVVRAERPRVNNRRRDHFMLVIGECGTDYIVADPGSTTGMTRYNPYNPELLLQGVRRYEQR